jgi:hypothetical protein
VVCSDFAGFEAFGSAFGSVRVAFSRAAVLGSAGRTVVCSDFAGFEAFGSVRVAFSRAAVLGSAGRAVVCSDFAGLDEALDSVLGCVFAIS